MTHGRTRCKKMGQDHLSLLAPQQKTLTAHVTLTTSSASRSLTRIALKRESKIAKVANLAMGRGSKPACASSHYWSRELQVLGHTVRLMPPAYVKPYVKRQKNDAADAEAICEAVTRANMRFVPTKTPEQQSCLMLHRTRQLFIRQQTAVINSIRAHLAEFGIVAPVGRRGVMELLHVCPRVQPIRRHEFWYAIALGYAVHAGPDRSFLLSSKRC
jgi:hypothetical protein